MFSGHEYLIVTAVPETVCTNPDIAFQHVATPYRERAEHCSSDQHTTSVLWTNLCGPTIADFIRM